MSESNRPKEQDFYPTCCFDCGLAYGSDGWADFVISNSLWMKISQPEEFGLLCVTCIIRRCKRQGFENLSGRFTSGPFAYPGEQPRPPKTVQVTRPRTRNYR